MDARNASRRLRRLPSPAEIPTMDTPVSGFVHPDSLAEPQATGRLAHRLTRGGQPYRETGVAK